MNETDGLRLMAEYSSGQAKKTLDRAILYIEGLERLLEAGEACAWHIVNPAEYPLGRGHVEMLITPPQDWWRLRDSPIEAAANAQKNP